MVEMSIDAMGNMPCKRCGNVDWINVFRMKVKPDFMTDTGKPELVPTMKATCYHCSALMETHGDMENTIPDSKVVTKPWKKTNS